MQEAAAADNGDDLEAAEPEGEGPEPDDIHTKHAITSAGLQTLAESWGSGLLHPLAERPRTARELRDAAGGRGERLEARLASMLRHGLLERAARPTSQREAR